MKQNKMANVSLIIPTYNRPYYLERILSYYDKYGDGEKYRIIVADSSSSKIKQCRVPIEVKGLNKKIVSLFPNLNIEHLHNYSPNTNIVNKIADTLDHINTKYCVICADDDFITPNGINRSIYFLEGNKDFTIVQGHSFAFEVKGDKKKKLQFYWKDTSAYKSMTFPRSRDRLNYHLSNYEQATFYGVHRTDFMRMIFDEAVKFTNDGFFGELLLSMLTILYGKMKHLDVLFAAREMGNVCMGTSPEYQSGLNAFIKGGTYDEKYTKFRDCLSTHLSKQSQVDIKESKKIIDNAMSAYMKKYYFSKSKVAYITTKAGKILDSLYLPNWLDKGIRKSYIEITKLKGIKKYFIYIFPFSKYYADFNRIRNHVLFYAKREY